MLTSEKKGARKDHKNFDDVSGKRFGEWLVLYRGPNLGPQPRYFCRCSCGTEHLVISCNLRSGKTSRCIKCAAILRSTHNMSHTPTYNVYVQMIERCHNPNHKYYSYYGERGIFVCDRWKQDFSNFLEDMGEKPNNLSIERINNNKGYFKDNCKWATKKEQQRNRRNSIFVGDVVNNWKIIDRGKYKKTWIVQCLNCEFIKSIRSCNFRKSGNHQCKEIYANK